MGLLSRLPIVRSSATRALFIGSAAISIGLMLWAHGGLHYGVDLSYIFYLLFTYYDSAGALCALLILIGAIFVPVRLRSRALLRWIGTHPILIALLTVILLCLGCLFIYRNHPLAMDEYSPYFQSQVFADGHLAGRFPVPLIDWLIPPDFQDYFLFVSRQTGAVASGYWPSFALLLTPFTWLGIPWACNPVISGLTLLVIHRLALVLFEDTEAAGVAVLFTIASPVFFANGISYYSMPAHLLANSLYALLLLKPTTGRAFLAGVVGSIALTLHNPFPHMLFAAPWWLWIAKRSDAPRLIGTMIVGYIPLSVLLGVGWLEFYSGLAQVDAAVRESAPNALNPLARLFSGFALPSSSTILARAIGIAKLWLWAVPGLLILAGLGAWKWRANPGCRRLLICALVTLLGYVIVPLDQGHGWGYRYFHSAWMAVPLLAAGVLTRTKQANAPDRFESDDFRTFVVACALLSLIAGVGQRALQMQDFIASDLRHVPAQSCHGRCVLFLNPTGASYALDLVQNDPWLRGNVLRMVSGGSERNAKLMIAWFPTMHRFATGPYGEAWSDDPPPTLPTGPTR